MAKTKGVRPFRSAVPGWLRDPVKLPEFRLVYPRLPRIYLSPCLRFGGERDEEVRHLLCLCRCCVVRGVHVVGRSSDPLAEAVGRGGVRRKWLFIGATEESSRG